MLTGINDVVDVLAWGLSTKSPLRIWTEPVFQVDGQAWYAPVFQYNGTEYSRDSCECWVDGAGMWNCICPFQCVPFKDVLVRGRGEEKGMGKG